MEAIHLKTVDPVGQALLRLASGQGLELSWDRFEALQPQDGFVRTGLSCAFGCMQGPCRIDPFGRGAKAGVCGLDRDGMVAANVLRLCLNGAVESGVDGGETFAAAAMLRRPQASVADMLRQALRLAQGVVAKAQDGAGTHALEVGYGTLAAAPAIGVAGTITADTAARLKGKRVVSLGSWAVVNGALLPFACTSGEAELTLVSRRISALFAGPDADPGLLALARRLSIPVGLDGSAAESLPVPDAGIAADQVGKAVVHFGAQAVAGALKGNGKPVALLGGFDTPHQSLGWLPTDVAPALMGDGCTVAAWGDAALWMAKAGLADRGHASPAVLVGPQGGALDVVKAVGPARIKGACFAGLRDSRDAALVLGLAALGVRVLVATPLPVWGSKPVMAALEDLLAASGGSLKHVDKPIGADEVRGWFSE